jgi:hypothetical protein
MIFWGKATSKNHALMREDPTYRIRATPTASLNPFSICKIKKTVSKCYSSSLGKTSARNTARHPPASARDVRRSCSARNLAESTANPSLPPSSRAKSLAPIFPSAFLPRAQSSFAPLRRSVVPAAAAFRPRRRTHALQASPPCTGRRDRGQPRRGFLCRGLDPCRLVTRRRRGTRGLRSSLEGTRQ